MTAREVGECETAQIGREMVLVNGQPISVTDPKALYQIPVRTLTFCVDFWLLCPPPLLPWAKSGSSLARPLFVGGLPCSSSSMSSQFSSRLCCCFRSCLFWQISGVLAPMLCWLGSHRSGFEHICCSVQRCFSQQELCRMRLFQQRQSDVRGLSWGLWASSSKLGVPWGTCVAVPIVLWLGTLAGSRDLSSWWVLFS